MGNFKGTKGKWHMMTGGFAKKGNPENMVQVYATNDDLEMICKVYQDGILTASIQNWKANALLVSKAPEMLEMLESIVSTWDTNQNFDEEYFNNIKNLIKKATEL